MNRFVRHRLQSREGTQRLLLCDPETGETKDVGAFVPTKSGRPMLVMNPSRDEPNGIFTIAKKDVVDRLFVVDQQSDSKLVLPNVAYRIAHCDDGRWVNIGVTDGNELMFDQPLPRSSEKRGPVLLFPITPQQVEGTSPSRS